MASTGREVVIVEAVRTPVGRGHPEKGIYRDVHPNELLGRSLREVIDRAGIEPGAVEDVIGGCVQQFGEQSVNVTRNAWLQAGLPALLIGDRVFLNWDREQARFLPSGAGSA